MQVPEVTRHCGLLSCWLGVGFTLKRGCSASGPEGFFSCGPEWGVGGGACSFCGRKVRGRRALSPGRPVGANVSCPPEPLSWPGPQPGLCPSSAPATSHWSSSGPKAVRALQPGGAEGGPAVPALTSPVAASRTAHRDQAPRTVLRGDGAAEASALPRRSDPHGRSANKARPAWRTEQDGAEGSGDSFPPRARGPPCGGQRWAGGRPLAALPRRAPLWPGPQPCALGPRQATCLLWRARSEPSSRQSNLCLDGPRLRWRITHGRVCVLGVGGGLAVGGQRLPASPALSPRPRTRPAHPPVLGVRGGPLAC